MIHAVCDFCGKDCGMSATLLTLTPFQNFARTPRSTAPFGASGEPKSFVICAKCAAGKMLPNPYENYYALFSQTVSYEKTLSNYTDEDHMADAARETERNGRND